MEYTGEEDPRWLGYEAEIDQMLLDELEKLPRLDDVLGMFETSAWTEVEKVLSKSLEESKSLAIGARTIEELCEYRGKIKALLVLLGLPRSLALDRERLREVSAQVAELDEGG